MVSDCLFCKIAAGNIPSEKIFENEKVMAFKDINPLAKEHYLFIHREHSSNVTELLRENKDHLTEIFMAIYQYAAQHNHKSLEKGFRIVTNQGEDGRQTVFHTHFHFLSGEKLGTFGR